MITLLGSALVVAAIVVAITGSSLLLAAGLAASAVGVFTLAPTTIGRPTGSPRRKVDATPAELRRWREEHPGSTIADAVAAHSGR
jgi:hypothetical protein